MTRNLRIAVCGAGANGAAVAAGLVLAGYDVSIFDAWPENVTAIRKNGVILRTPSEESATHVNAFHISEIAHEKSVFDFVILGVKAYDTTWSLELMKNLLADKGHVIGIQNGMTMSTTSSVVGEVRTLGAVIEVASSMFVPGVVEQQVPFWFGVGSPTSSKPEGVATALELFSSVGETEIIDDISSAKWMKLIANTAELVTSAILNLPLVDAVQMERMHELMFRVGAETAKIAINSGHTLIPIFNVPVRTASNPEQYAFDLLQGVLDSYTKQDTLTTVLQDWRKGRRAEIHDIHGYVIQVAKAVGSPHALNSHILSIAERIERGELTPGIQNLSVLTSVLDLE